MTSAFSLSRGTAIGRPGQGAVFRHVGYLLVGLFLMMQGNVARSALVSYDYGLDFATDDQNSYATGPTGAFTSDFFLGLDTGYQRFHFGGTEKAELFGIDLGEYGAEVGGIFDLRTGFEIATRNDSGTIDAAQSFLTSLMYDDQRLTGQFTDLVTSQQSTEQWMQTTFPNVGLDVDFAFDLETSIDGKGCVVDCVDFTLIPYTSAETDFDVFDYNRDIDGDGAPDGLVELFGVGIDEEFAAYQTDTETVVGGGATTEPALQLNLELPFKKGVSLGYVRVEVPQPHTEATELYGDSTLHSAAEDDFIEIGADVDSLLVLIPGVGPIINQINSNGITLPNVELGIGYDLLNFNVEWDMDYSQEFTLLSNLVVELAFSEPVVWLNNGIYELISSWQGSWLDVPDFTLLHPGTVTATPTFDLAATLWNLTELDYDLDFILELITLWYDFGLLGSGSFALFEGEWPVDLFRTTVFDDEFSLIGWNSVAGDSFDVHFSEAPMSDSLYCSTLRDTYELYEAYADSYETADSDLLAFLNDFFYVRQNLYKAWLMCKDSTPTTMADTCEDQLALLYDAQELFPADNGYIDNSRLVQTISIAEVTCETTEPVSVTTVFIPDPPPDDGGNPNGDETATSVPEPHVLLLLGLGLGLLGFLARRQR